MSLYGASENHNDEVVKLLKENEFDTRRLLILNSYDRDDVYSTTSSRFQITLERTVKIKKLRLESAVIPLAAPVLSTTDALGNIVALSVAFQEQAGGGELTVAIPLKVNYTASNFATDMSTLMTAASANALTYTVTYDSETMNRCTKESSIHTVCHRNRVTIVGGTHKVHEVRGFYFIHTLPVDRDARFSNVTLELIVSLHGCTLTQ